MTVCGKCNSVMEFYGVTDKGMYKYNCKNCYFKTEVKEPGMNVLDILTTVEALLEDHDCKFEEIDGFTIKICKVCHANLKVKEILDLAEEKKLTTLTIE